MNTALHRLAEILFENQQDAATDTALAVETAAGKVVLVEEAAVRIQQLQQEIEKLKQQKNLTNNQGRDASCLNA